MTNWMGKTKDDGRTAPSRFWMAKKLVQQKHEGVMPCKNGGTFSMDHTFTRPIFPIFLVWIFCIFSLYGLRAWIYQRLLIVLIGGHCGRLWGSMVSLLIWFGCYKWHANQKGQVLSNTDRSHEFDICAGVRQGCVLSPRLFCSVLQLAMGRWRSQVEHLGLNLGDGMLHLLDLRFADDILLFRESAQAVGSMRDPFVACLEQVGLKLNASKTKVLTTQAQPPSTLTTPAGLELEVLEPTNSHKWLGCLLSTANTGNRQQDMNYRLQNASRAFQANRWILCDKNVSIALRLKFFDAMVTSVVCFAAGHRKVYVGELRKLDVHAENCYGAWLDHRRMPIGMGLGMKFCMSGTSV